MPLRNGHETRSQSYAALANPLLYYTKSIKSLKQRSNFIHVRGVSAKDALSLSRRMISSVQWIISVTFFVDHGAEDVFHVVIQMHHNLPMSG